MNGNVSMSITGNTMDKQKIMANNFKYYSDISDIGGSILGTIPEKVRRSRY